MEATTAGYVHTGVMVVAIGLMILHGILLRVAPVKRFMRQQWNTCGFECRKPLHAGW